MTLERVFTEQQPLLRRRLARMTGDAELAGDLCQEVFVRAWRCAPREAPAVAIAAWLHRTASNLAVDELRRRSRRPVAADAQLDRLLAPPAAHDERSARPAPPRCARSSGGAPRSRASTTRRSAASGGGCA